MIPRVSDFVTIETLYFPWDAHIARGLLASEGIPAVVFGEHHVGAQWPWVIALGGVRLRVPADRTAEARAILARRDQGEFEDALVEQEGLRPMVCQDCGFTEFVVTRSWTDAAMAVVLQFLTGVVYPVVREQRCASCGSRVQVES